MKKLIKSAINRGKERLKKLVKKDYPHTEDEIFTDTDGDGFNHNPSEQHNYPGIRKHTSKPPKP